MMDADGEDGFRVTDRRRRSEDDAPAPVAPAPVADFDQEDADGPTLTGLFTMLGDSAVAALDAEPRQAREIIEVLLLLQKKTAGNRTADETQVLDELVYDLQTRYVDAMKRSG